MVLGIMVVASCAAPPDAPRESEVTGASTYVYPARSDHWGCDTDNQGPNMPIVNSFGDHGACCDSHDACMAAAPGCKGDAAHWQVANNCRTGAQTMGCNDPCIQCHLAVMGCVFGGTTGPSQCVAYGNCGDARRADDPFGCTNDQICKVRVGAFSVCNPSNGVCSPNTSPGSGCPTNGCYSALQQRCLGPNDCGPGYHLDTGFCQCVADQPSCTPCLGQSCGLDHCGTGRSCGSCPSGYSCNSQSSCERVDTCFSVCGNGVCECSESSYCPSDCIGGPDNDDCIEDCHALCGGTASCFDGNCMCGT